MTSVTIGLSSTMGDRLGHLVRGVQMLRSYGSEAEVLRYSPVVYAAVRADEEPGLYCVLECDSDADLDGLRGICRDTEWALGDEPEVLTVHLLQYGDLRFGGAPEPLEALEKGKLSPGAWVYMPDEEFAKLCDWGQGLADGDTDIMGEWPSATGG